MNTTVNFSFSGQFYNVSGVATILGRSVYVSFCSGNSVSARIRGGTTGSHTVYHLLAPGVFVVINFSVRVSGDGSVTVSGRVQ